MSKSGGVDKENVNDETVDEKENKKSSKESDDDLGDDGDSSFIDGTKGEEIKDPADDKKKKKSVEGEKNRDYDYKGGSSISHVVANICGWCGILSIPTFIGLTIGFSNPLFLIGSGCGLVVAIIGFVVNDNLNFNRNRHRLFTSKKNTSLERSGKSGKKNDRDGHELDEDENELGDDIEDEEQPQKSADKKSGDNMNNLLKMFGGGREEKSPQDASPPPVSFRPSVSMPGVVPAQQTQTPPLAPVAPVYYAHATPAVPYQGAPAYSYVNPAQPVVPYQPAMGLPQSQVQFPSVQNH